MRSKNSKNNIPVTPDHTKKVPFKIKPKERQNVKKLKKN